MSDNPYVSPKQLICLKDENNDECLSDGHVCEYSNLARDISPNQGGMPKKLSRQSMLPIRPWMGTERSIQAQCDYFVALYSKQWPRHLLYNKG